MAQANNNMSAREVALERRRAMATGGKAALAGMRQASGAASSSDARPAPSAPSAPAVAAPSSPGMDAKTAARARRLAMSTRGKAALANGDRVRTASAKPAASTARSAPVQARGQAPAAAARPASAPVSRPAVDQGSARAASRARRVAMSKTGKAAILGASAASAQSTPSGKTRATGRDVAKAVREQRAKNGGASQAPMTTPARQGQSQQAAAKDAHWKVGATETTGGQKMTGTMVGRGARMTGNEPGSCKAITGSEYVGVDQMEAFCGTSSSASARSRVTSSMQTRKGKSGDGDMVGRGSRMTGDDFGAERQLTGTQYMSRGTGTTASAPASRFANTAQESDEGRARVRMTGDAGNSSTVTGDDYVGQEYAKGFAEKPAPMPSESKGTVSPTLRGSNITGAQTDRSEKITGSEAGTCRAVSGTQYGGSEAYEGNCRQEDTSMAMARARRPQANVGAVMTGLQPGIGGHLTGAARGACDNLTGTPYVGADQYAQACDVPNPREAWDADFSVNSPVHASQTDEQHSAITGSHYEAGRITGSFGKGTGKLTGTDESGFGGGSVMQRSYSPQMVGGREQSRVTGEGSGLKITGDDWDRGDTVTGTEGTSARRNQTRRGMQSSVMMPRDQSAKRNDNLPVPNSKVTGGSGNTDKGSLITYSGGARG